jgi:hypothetical protein
MKTYTVYIISLIIAVVIGAIAIYLDLRDYYKRKKKGKEERNLPLKNRR